MSQMNWDRVVKTVREESEGNEDFKVRACDLMLWEGDGSLVASADLLGGQTLRRLDLTDWASQQLFQKLGIPVSYARKLPSNVLAQNVNYWLSKEPEKRFLLRAKESGPGLLCRAFLSDRYQPYDNIPIIEAVDKCLPDSDLIVKDFHLNDSGFHLKMISPSLSFKVGNLLTDNSPDIVSSGFYVTNSEIGSRSVRIGYYVERLVCSNGLIGIVPQELFHQRHIGLSPAQFDVGVIEGIGKALNASQDTVYKLVESRKRTVESPADIIARIIKANRMSQRLGNEVMVRYGEESVLAGDNEFSIIQAFTRAAKDQESERRVELESLAGYMLENSVVAATRSNYIDTLAEEEDAA